MLLKVSFTGATAGARITGHILYNTTFNSMYEKHFKAFI
jgi:hypothetical protein